MPTNMQITTRLEMQWTYHLVKIEYLLKRYEYLF